MYCKFLVLTFFIFIAGCKTDENNFQLELPGKLAYLNIDQNIESSAKKISIYIADCDTIFECFSNERLNLGEISWLNTEDLFLANQRMKVDSDGFNTSKEPFIYSILLLDPIHELVLDTIYQSSAFEVLSNIYPSPDDSLFTFIIKKVPRNIEKFTVKESSLHLFDLKNRVVRNHIEKISPNFSIFLAESPWSKDGDKIVFWSGHSFINEESGEKENDYLINKKGVYLLSLKDSKVELIVENGEFGIWSPEELKVAYIKNNNIWIYDYQTDKSQLLYKSKLSENLSRIHWSPDGDYLRVQGWRYTALGYLFEKPVDRLLKVDNGQEILFKAIGGTSYTWK
jgi:hypothetical protein